MKLKRDVYRVALLNLIDKVLDLTPDGVNKATIEKIMWDACIEGAVKELEDPDFDYAMTAYDYEDEFLKRLRETPLSKKVIKK
jgi:hypothetical protein